MDLLEHQGKRLFAAAGLPVLPAAVAATPEEALLAAGELGLPVVVKAQAKTGGRGKAGGIRVCRSAGEVEAAATEILAMSIRGKAVESLLVEQAVEIERELYLAIASSRALRGPLLIFAREGGVDIEDLARRDPGGHRPQPDRPAARPLRLPGAGRRGRRRPRPRGAGRPRGEARPSRPSCARSGSSITTATPRWSR